MAEHPRAFKYYVALVVVLAAGGTTLLTRDSAGAIDAASLVALGVLAQVAESLAVSLPIGGSVSLSYSAVYAAVLLTGGLPAVVVALCGSVTLPEIRERKPLLVVVFNAAQMGLSVVASCLVLRIFDVSPLSDSGLQGAVTWGTLCGWALSALVLWSVNAFVFAVAMSLIQSVSLRRVLHVQKLVSFLINLGFLAPLGFLMAVILLRRGWPTLLVLAVPFVLERQVLRAHARLAESYTETVRLLVSAIESKDSYTRGHSERVAQMAKSLATRLRLSARQVDLVERAALLHDIGKIEVPLPVLLSPDALGPDELDAIRRHPATGAELVGRIELVSEAGEAVLCHHERPDGTGYPRGLRDDAIPMIARILACVDAFDAMTSNRPYRAAVDQRIALEEIRRAAGTQFDSRIALEFIEMMSASHDKVSNE